MSFLEKPFILPDRAMDDQSPVNYNLFKTFSKKDSLDIKNGNKKTFSIIWTPNEAMQSGQTIEWRYNDEMCRNLDYTDLIAKISLPLST